MKVAVAHIMTNDVVFASPDHTVDYVRELMALKKVHALPVVTASQTVIGVVTTADVARRIDGEEKVAHVMSEMIVTIGATEPASKAARLMRKHRIHHLVTDKDKAIAMLSSFDLLKLVEQNAG